MGESGAPVISARGLTKEYGRRRAVDGVTFDVRSGRVTGFLGPNGAGKTTTLRMLLGLATPTAGSSLVRGQPFSDLERPSRSVGVLLDPGTYHPRRTARDHLRWMAAAAGVHRARVETVLQQVELGDAADRRVGQFSTGMRQRLGLAVALLGEPELLILDEPANGLDPAGIRWLRRFLRSFADAGGSVFVSSHILPEVAQVADEVVVIDRGRLIAHTSVADLSGGAEATRVRTPDTERFRAVLADAGADVSTEDGGALNVRGLTIERVGELAAAQNVVLHELARVQPSLEEVFFQLTEEARGDA